MPRFPMAFAPLVAFCLAPSSAYAETPCGVEIVKLLGPHAVDVFGSRGSDRIGAVVTLPPGVSAESLGLDLLAPGFARFRATAPDLIAFASTHPEASIEVYPPLHTLLDKSGQWIGATVAHTHGADGKGVLVGVADTGLDVSHPDLIDQTTGLSRVAWLLDLSLQPLGVYPDLELKYGIKDASGKVVAGAVLQGVDIDQLLARKARAPQDAVGHGTHVTSIAAGNGGTVGTYVGVAPAAQIVFARITRDDTDSIGNDDMLSGVAFLFDRADSMHMPVAVNLSLGSDFGPHDGSMSWEQTLASFVGPEHPGHALVIAAGNSGSIAETPVHQSVHVVSGSTTRVRLVSPDVQNGQVEIWVAMRYGANLSVGLEGPDGEWVPPISDGNQQGYAPSGKNINAGVYNGSKSAQSPVPNGSHGAVVVWTGAWPAGTYNVTLEGEGTADLFVQGTGDASGQTGAGVGFVYAVREGTINLPATHPGLIAVGCTVNRPNWTSIDGAKVGLTVPELDLRGGLPATTTDRLSLVGGDVCWFSSAGPNLLGVPKPEISAPGGIVVAAMSAQAAPGSANSIFTNPDCPPVKKGGSSDPRCLQVDAGHAVSVGTSMSAPQVAGAVALLFQREPTLTQDKIVALLQAGAHEFRTWPNFEDQGGPGELDVLGSLDAMDQLANPTMELPSADKSWLTLSADYLAADGSTPLVAFLELRTADGAHRADLFDTSRLQPVVKLDNELLSTQPPLVRRAPGLWVFTIQPPPGLGGRSVTLGATFDGAEIVTEKTIPIAADEWSANYPSSAKGSCAVEPRRANGRAPLGILVVALAALRRRRSRHGGRSISSGSGAAARSSVLSR